MDPSWPKALAPDGPGPGELAAREGPMNDTIRAMSFGEILDVGFRIVRDRFAVLFGLTAIGYIPIGLLMAGFNAEAGQVPDPAELFVSLGLIFLYSLLMLPVVMAATTHVVGEWLLGRSVALTPSLRFGLSIYLPMVGTFFLWYLALMGLALVLAGAFASFAVVGPFGIVVALAALLGTGWAFLGLLLVPQIMVLEKVFGMLPLRRSWDLLAGHRGRAFGIVVVLGVLTLVLQGAFVLPTLPFPSVSPIAQYLGQGLAQALSTAASCALYVDLRCRREAFDLEHLARQVDGGEASGGAPDVSGPGAGLESGDRLRG